MGDFTNLKIIHSGERLEIFKVNNYIITSGKCNNATGRRGKAELSKEQKANNSKHNRKQTLQQARNNIIRLIKCKNLFNVRICMKQLEESSFRTVLGCSVEDRFLKQREFYIVDNQGLRKGKTYDIN